MSIKCPCCKQDVKTESTIMIDTKTGLLSALGLENPVRLCPQESIVMDVLIRAMPGPIDRDGLLMRLYNGHNEPGWADKVLSVLVCKIRHKLSGSNWKITPGHYGYRLARTDVNPIVVQQVVLQEVAHGG